MLKGLYHASLSYLCILIREEIALYRGGSSWNIKSKTVRIDAAKNLHNAWKPHYKTPVTAFSLKRKKKRWMDGV